MKLFRIDIQNVGTFNIHKLPDTVIDSLVSKIQALQNKYATTFFEVEQQISETEATLSGMIDDLEGNEYDMLGLNELKKLLGGSAEYSVEDNGDGRRAINALHRFCSQERATD